MDDYLVLLIPVVTKGLISLIRQIQDLLPKATYPLLAPVLGILLDQLIALGSPEAAAGPMVAAIAGASGVALHEALKQLGITKKA